MGFGRPEVMELKSKQGKPRVTDKIHQEETRDWDFRQAILLQEVLKRGSVTVMNVHVPYWGFEIQASSAGVRGLMPVPLPEAPTQN